jgi:hypothetical protein
MTTEQLAGRTLDEAAARAMGWRDFTPAPHTRVMMGAAPDGELDYLPNYCTDAARIPEMLAWLHPLGSVEIHSNRAGCLAFIVGDDVACNGATLQEALARLVCQVAKERGK